MTQHLIGLLDFRNAMNLMTAYLLRMEKNLRKSCQTLVKITQTKLWSNYVVGTQVLRD